MDQVFGVRFEKMAWLAVILDGLEAFAERRSVGMKLACCLFAAIVLALTGIWSSKTSLAQVAP